MKVRFVLPIVLMLGLMGVGLLFVPKVQAVPPVQALNNMEQFGKALFFDANLSINNNQSCATCHSPEVGYTGAAEEINLHGGVYEGSIPGAYGDRKPPSASYAGDSPILYYDEENEAWVGGMFWDGRATGWHLGDPLAEQAKGPFLNPKEQAIPTAEALCEKVTAAPYASLYELVYGVPLDCSTPAAVTEAYNNFGRAIAAYERSLEVNPFSSPFDRFWDNAKNKGLDVADISMNNWSKYKRLGLDNDELRGLAMFNTQAKCSACHTLEEGSAGYPLFTDFTYDNLGMPKNPENPMTLSDPEWADPGLGGFLQSAGYDEEVYTVEMGKFKVPSLRNVALSSCDPNLVKAYGHNAYFKSLETIVHFYNTRDVKHWPAPEVAENVNTSELGNLRLNKPQERWIVAFLKTLSDDTTCPQP